MSSEHEHIARRYGPIGALTYERQFSELASSGISKTQARFQAELSLRTCSKCGHSVSLTKRASNRRQRDDGGLDHVVCDPSSDRRPQ